MIAALGRSFFPRQSCAEIFSDIYRRNMWGGEPGEFYSGAGSDEMYSQPFAELVRTFIADHKITSVVDLGCGDFRTGKRISGPGVFYTGIDVVESLIERNNRLFASDTVRFVCADAVDGDLPHGDLCIVRQVLQHLSNRQVSKIMARLNDYRWAIIGEHHPSPKLLKKPNLDRLAGYDTRVEADSGVFLEYPPFTIPNAKVIARLPLPYLRASGEKLTVYLIDHSDWRRDERACRGGARSDIVTHSTASI